MDLRFDDMQWDATKYSFSTIFAKIISFKNHVRRI